MLKFEIKDFHMPSYVAGLVVCTGLSLLFDGAERIYRKARYGQELWWVGPKYTEEWKKEESEKKALKKMAKYTKRAYKENLKFEKAHDEYKKLTSTEE